MYSDELKLKKIDDTNFLLIINNSYSLNSKSYERGQCVKSINSNRVLISTTQEEVDIILATEHITRLIIDKKVMTRSNIKLNRDRNGEIRNGCVIVLPYEDEDEAFHIISIDSFFIEVCDVVWYKINSQSVLNGILEENSSIDNLDFVYINSSMTDAIEAERNVRKQYLLNMKEEKV